MAEYHSPTVVQPKIPSADMTPLERLILDLAFDAEIVDACIDYNSWDGPSSIVTLPVEDLREACEASREPHESRLRDHVAALLAQHDGQAVDEPSADIDIDLTAPGISWEQVFQDIVRRSPTIDEIVVTSAWTCTKMRPDGFGGAVMLITAHAILYRSTEDMLEEMRGQPQPPDGAMDIEGLETCSRLEEMAAIAGWDSFTLLLLISRWLNKTRRTGTLVDHLQRLVDDDGD